MAKVRIEDRQNAMLNGRKVTMFTVFEYRENQRAYVHAGQYSATGFDATGARCLSAYIAAQDDLHGIDLTEV